VTARCASRAVRLVRIMGRMAYDFDGAEAQLLAEWRHASAASGPHAR
jgi:hypothetical protein